MQFPFADGWWFGRLQALLPVLAGSLLAAAMSAPVQSLPDVTREQLEAARKLLPELIQWIEETGLGESIEVLRLRRASHPDADSDRKILRLETRWLHSGANRTEALALFAAFDDRFASLNHQRFGEKLLFKLKHLLGESLYNVSVHVHVLDVDIATLAEADQQIVTRESALRSVRARVDVPLPDFSGQVPILASPASAPLRAGDLPDMERLLGFLQSHFQEARFRPRALESDYLEFEVEGLRGKVISDYRYWEHIQGSLYVLNDPQAVRLRLHLDGRYAASGLGGRPPTRSSFRDMEPIHTAAVQSYADELILLVRQELMENREGQ